MLTADLVRAKKRGTELSVSPVPAKQRAAALELAELLIRAAREHVGRTREEAARVWTALAGAHRDRKLALGLVKLVEDACEFSSDAVADAALLRSEVFLRASAARAELAPAERFDRERVLVEAGRELGVPLERVDEVLYSDLRGAQLLLAVEPLSCTELLVRYEHAQYQAVLLRAVKVRADVQCGSPAEYRALFHKLKFRRLLYQLHPRAEGGYRIEIDGPFSLFESVTKYGLQLALLLPALSACESLSLVADVRWGKQREPLVFRLESRRERAAGDDSGLAVSDEVTALLQALRAQDSPFRVRLSQAILELAAVGLCVPDLEFEHRETGEILYLEVLGYWSREAVWRRVELVEQGLRERILFAVSSRLRVSEEVLEDDELGALYVYKGSMSPRTVLARLEELRNRRQPRPAAKRGAGAASLSPRRHRTPV
jgi:predicted nuclease of restriction endonuclease-like RecB superfamily